MTQNQLVSLLVTKYQPNMHVKTEAVQKVHLEVIPLYHLANLPVKYNPPHQLEQLLVKMDRVHHQLKLSNVMTTNGEWHLQLQNGSNKEPLKKNWLLVLLFTPIFSEKPRIMKSAVVFLTNVLGATVCHQSLVLYNISPLNMLSLIPD